jgi:hypothetical protein
MVEADACQFVRCRACPSLTRRALPRVTAGEVRLDEVARHALDARAVPAARKRKNV